MDGRAQLPIINWMKKQFHLDYVDMVTEPGPDKIMAAGQSQEIASIKSKVIISVKAHGSNIVLIAGHYDCAGNPVAEEQHRKQIKDAIQVVRNWNLPVDKIIGVWINKDWEIEVVDSLK
jgi:hypothetical protein